MELAAAFREVFDRDYGYVRHSLRRLGVREADCDDVANEVFVRVHRHFAEFDPTRPTRPWLFAFCARLASDHRRLARHRREAAMDGDVGIAPSTPESDALRREAKTTVQTVLDALEDDRRQVFVLHEIDGVSIPEVARVLALPLGTAYTRLRLARADFIEAARRLGLGGAR